MDVLMPQLGETVTEGKILTWFKAPGDRVEAGEDLFEIETDKVTVEVQAPSSGFLSEVRVSAGETAAVGALVAQISDAPGRDDRGGDAGRSGRTADSGTVKSLDPLHETNTPHLEMIRRHEGINISPLARRIIARDKLDAAGIIERAKREGIRRIGKAHVETAMPQAGAGTAAVRGGGNTPDDSPTSGRTFPLNTLRRQTGERLEKAWREIPHAFQAVEINYSEIEKVRQNRKGDFLARHGFGLTYLPFVARAVCLALAEFPHLNARLGDNELRLSAQIHLGIAVDLSHDGLVVPVIHNAGDLTVTGLARAIFEKAELARAGKLQVGDLSGGTYTITNNGAFGTLMTAPVINPPQVAILSTDAVRRVPLAVRNGGVEAIAIQPVGVVGQSFDHRALDGAYAAAFLGKVKDIVEIRNWAQEIE